MLEESISSKDEARYKNVFDLVIVQQAGKSAWSLNRLSHGESSWNNARMGLNLDTRTPTNTELRGVKHKLAKLMAGDKSRSIEKIYFL